MAANCLRFISFLLMTGFSAFLLFSYPLIPSVPGLHPRSPAFLIFSLFSYFSYSTCARISSTQSCIPDLFAFLLFLLLHLCKDFIFAVLHCGKGLLQQLVQVPAQHLRSPGNDFARAARREGLALVFLLERFQFHVLCAL